MYANIGPYPNDDRPNEERAVTVSIHDYDTWSLDHTLALVIHPALIAFRKDMTGVPNKFLNDNGIVYPKWDGTSDEEDDKFWNAVVAKWKAEIDKMIQAFYLIINDEGMYTEVQEQQIQDGLESFGRYYRALWT